MKKLYTKIIPNKRALTGLFLSVLSICLIFFGYKITIKNNETSKITTPVYENEQSQSEVPPQMVSKLNEIDPFTPRGYHVSSSTVFYFDKKLEGADSVSFRKLNDWYAKDKNNVYYVGEVVSGIDAETFVIASSTFFVKDKRYVYINNEKINGSVDPYTVEFISYNIIKDSKNVYYIKDDSNRFAEPIVGADPVTFIYVGTCGSVEKSSASYFKDKHRIYIENQPQVNIDTSTFEFFGNFPNQEGSMPYSTSYAKDKNHVYIGCGNLDEKIDPATFKIVDKEFAQDSRYIIFMGKIIEGADRATFTRINDMYGKDKNHIYVYGSPMQVDIDTWQPLSRSYSVDKDFVYIGGRKSDIYDRKTFKIFPDSFYVQDKNGIYSGEEKLKDVSASTFKILGGPYATDGKRVYYTNCYASIDEANVESFQVVDVDHNFSKDRNYVYSNCSVIPELDPTTTVNIGYGSLKDKSIVYLRGGSKFINVDVATFRTIDEYTQEDKNYVYQDGKVLRKK